MTLYEFWSEASEEQRQAWVKHIRGAVEYGTAVTWNLLPEAARQIVTAEYDQFIKTQSAPELEATIANAHAAERITE